MSDRPRLIVFAGLPGSGKSLLSRLTAQRLGITLLRVDTIETAVKESFGPFRDPVGYVTAEWLAGDQLRDGREVLVDAVNNSELARGHWRGLAERTDADLRLVEITCRDRDEHRRRVETREPERPGWAQPTWDQVCHRGWEPISGPYDVVDNSGDAGDALAQIVEALSRPPRFAGATDQDRSTTTGA